MEYGGYEIKVKYVTNTFEAVGIKGRFRESSYGDTEEDAIKYLKQKIDNIDVYKDMNKEKQE